MAYYFRRSVLPSRLVTRRVIFAQPQLALRNSKPILFQSSFSKSYTLFYSTKANENNKESVEKNENVEEKEEIIIEETKKHSNKIEKTPPSHSYTFSDKSSPYFIKNTLPTAFANYFFSGIALFILGDSIYCWYQNRRNERLINETVEKGTRPESKVADDELVYRPEIIGQLMKIFQPPERHSFYHVICGEHGAGKTILTKVALKEVGQDKDKGIQGGMGVIYVDIPANTNINSFGDAFGKALKFKEHITLTQYLVHKILGITKETSNYAKWVRVMDAFKRSAEVYKAKYKKPPVIVYDNISRLDPKILDILQDDAKDNADDQRYIAVFISNEESVSQRMQSRSAWSRVITPVIEISDLSEKESMEYLDKRKINKVKAKKLYELFGGRIIDLKANANKILNGQSLKVIKQEILTGVEHKFITAKLFKNSKYYDVGKHIIKTLLDSKELSREAFYNFFKKPEEANEVLKTNVFTYHPAKNTITFQSQSVEYYIREKANIYLK